MAEPLDRRVAGRRWIDPLIVESVTGWLATLSPDALAQMARERQDVAEPIKRQMVGLGWFDFLLPAAARAALGPERVEDLRNYDDADFHALLEAVADSRPAHGTILRAHEEWAITQLRQLRDMIVSG